MRHREQHRSSRIGWLRAAVLGANDGILATASLIVGVASAAASREEILVAGVAGLRTRIPRPEGHSSSMTRVNGEQRFILSSRSVAGDVERSTGCDWPAGSGNDRGRQRAAYRVLRRWLSPCGPERRSFQRHSTQPMVQNPIANRNGQMAKARGTTTSLTTRWGTRPVARMNAA